VGSAGLIDTWLGDTRDLAYSAQSFTGGDGTVGQERRTADVRPDGEPYELLREGQEPGTGPVRVGPNFVLNPASAGLQAAADFRPPVAKSVRKRVGFSDVVLGPMPGSNYFDGE